MSGQSSGEKTELPTPKKIRDARKKGQVAVSKDFASAILLGALFGTMAYLGSDWVDALSTMIQSPAYFLDEEFDVALGLTLEAVFALAMTIIAPVILIIIVIGILAYMLQFGPLMAFEALKPDMNKINPVNNAKNIFGKKKLLEFLMNVLKVLLLTFVLYHVILGTLHDILHAPSVCGIVCVLVLFASMVGQLAFFSVMIFVVIGAADFLIKKKLHTKDLMMTKDEVKREYKEMEGDPHIKGKRKQMFQEIAMNQMTEKVKKASVIVTNPKHIAVALYYEKGKTPLPILLAKGEGGMARLITETATKEGIPIMQNVPLARSLYSSVEEESYIPSDLIEEVSAVFRWLQKLKQSQSP
ncbi:MAG: type III secretion system export apparatus subunit SctU [Alphaproteobacteria bacterium GM7ARS4]|nr:type III secretion system export apparatus subunit SctU [Alphaproteobacteria bacterium GM7ARS4]